MVKVGRAGRLCSRPGRFSPKSLPPRRRSRSFEEIEEQRPLWPSSSLPPPLAAAAGSFRGRRELSCVTSSLHVLQQQQQPHQELESTASTASATTQAKQAACCFKPWSKPKPACLLLKQQPQQQEGGRRQHSFLGRGYCISPHQEEPRGHQGRSCCSGPAGQRSYRVSHFPFNFWKALWSVSRSAT